MKNIEKLNFEKKILNLPQQLDKKCKFSGVGMDRALGSESRSSWVTFIIDL